MHNRFVDCLQNNINFNPAIGEPITDATIKFNDFYPTTRREVTIAESTKRTEDLTQNYWGTTDIDKIRWMIWPTPDVGEITVDYSNPLAYPDSDLDELRDNKERRQGTDPYKMDTDGDCLIDGKEIEHGTDPLKWDSDKDGIPDGLEVYIGTDPKKRSSMTPIGSSGDFFYDHIMLN